MREFSFEKVKDMIDNMKPKINEMTIEEFTIMVINDVRIMNHVQKFIMPLLDFNCTIAFNLDMIYGKDGGTLLNKAPLDPDYINHLKKEFKDEYYTKTRIVSFRITNTTSKNAEYYAISIDGNMYDVISNNTINLDTFAKNRIISAYMLYHSMLHNWIESNIYNLDMPKEEKKEEIIKWYTGDKIPKLDSYILIELKRLPNNFNSTTRYGAGYFHAPEPELEDDLYYNLRMCNGEFVEFENKKAFTSIVKRWFYLE